MAVAAALINPRGAQAARPCPPDINCSGSVNIDDLLAVINSWGMTGTAADVNGSGHVDIDDLLAVINAWGMCQFNFGTVYANAEAHQIGLETLGSTGPLSLAQSMYERIVHDQSTIRAMTPGLANQTHSPAWLPNQLIIGLTIVPAHPEFECLNTFYQVIQRQLLFTSGNTQYWVLTFAGKINVAALGPIYDALGDVTSAEPNGLIGGENFWRIQAPPSGNWQLDIDDGFLDCFDGCDCHRYYRFYTYPDGAAMLVSYSEQGAPWCVFNNR